MYMIKLDSSTYECKHEDKTLFEGKRQETLAFGHWNFGIPKDQMTKALDLLDKKASKIIFDVSNNIIDEPLDIA